MVKQSQDHIVGLICTIVQLAAMTHTCHVVCVAPTGQLNGQSEKLFGFFWTKQQKNSKQTENAECAKSANSASLL